MKKIHNYLSIFLIVKQKLDSFPPIIKVDLLESGETILSTGSQVTDSERPSDMEVSCE